jgi:hypothetical protein
MFPIGSDPAAYRLETAKLTDEALTFLDEWVVWLLTGSLPPESILGMVREGFSSL